MPRWTRLLAFAALASSAGAHLAWAQPAEAQPADRPADGTVAVVGAHVFDGERFERRDVFVDGGRFVAERPARIDTVLDARGGFIVPPYGDFHSHALETVRDVDDAAARYLHEGTFYVQNLTAAASEVTRVRSRFQAPGTLDVAYALGGFTSTHSHPQILIESYAMGLSPYRLTAEQRGRVLAARSLAGDAYWLVDTVADVEAAWPRFLAGEPDLVKVYLLNAAAGVEAGDMAGRGLHPDVLAEVVRRARSASLRVLAHVETADDVRLALDAGVDGLAHLPGYAVTSYPHARYDALAADGWQPYHLSDEIVDRLGARGLPISPTVHLASTNMAWNYPDRPARLLAVRARQWDTLRRLRAAGAQVTVGLDGIAGTTWAEAEYMATHGLFSPAAMLRTWTTVTPRAIFPDRAIGEVAPGYEASLLVLDCDPLADFGCTQRIRSRIKDGVVLPQPATEPSPGG